MQGEKDSKASTERIGRPAQQSRMQGTGHKAKRKLALCTTARDGNDSMRPVKRALAAATTTMPAHANDSVTYRLAT